MQPRRLGDITINRIVELEAPYVTLAEIFDEAVPEAVEPHRHWLEPKALDPKSGKFIMPVQSYLLRSRHHTILIDTCIGCTKCEQVCPVDCIESTPFKLHSIDLDVCTRCDACLVVCPVEAILAGSR